jgi:transposase
VGVNKTIASYYFNRLRELIYDNSEDAGFLEGEIEVDESYFSGQRKGKQGRASAGKIPVFGLLKRNDKVYAAMIPNAKTKTLMPIIRKKGKAR